MLAEDGPIVVGHDGSANADEALDVALQLAAALHAETLVVRAWTIDTAPHGALFHDGHVSPLSEVSTVVRQDLVDDVRMTIDDHPRAPVEYLAVLGDSAEVLLTQSAGARLLVVGSRGRGGFASLLLGSTSEQCARHAECPVLVAHLPRVGAQARRAPSRLSDGSDA